MQAAYLISLSLDQVIGMCRFANLLQSNTDVLKY